MASAITRPNVPASVTHKPKKGVQQNSNKVKSRGSHEQHRVPGLQMDGYFDTGWTTLPNNDIIRPSIEFKIRNIIVQPK